MQHLVPAVLLLASAVFAAALSSQQLQINEHFALSGFLREAAHESHWAEKCVLLLLERDHNSSSSSNGAGRGEGEGEGDVRGSTFVQRANDSYFLLLPERDAVDSQAWLFVYDATCGDPLLRVAVQLEERFTRLNIDLPASREFECFSALNPCEVSGRVLPHHLWPPGRSPLLLAHQGSSETPEELDRAFAVTNDACFLGTTQPDSSHRDGRRPGLIIVDGVAAAVTISFLVVLHLVNCCTYACLFTKPSNQCDLVHDGNPADCTAVSLPPGRESRRRHTRAHSRDQMWELLTRDQGHLGLRR